MAECSGRVVVARQEIRLSAMETMRNTFGAKSRFKERRQRAYVAGLSLVGSLLLGDIARPQSSPQASPSTTSDRMAARLKQLEGQVRKMEIKLWQLQNAEKSVVFDPTDLPSGFQRIQTNNGTFLLSLKEVEPYLDGMRVTLEVGNPSAADYKGFTCEAQWGSRQPDDADALVKWFEKLNKKSLSFPDTLSAGVWNRVTFVLSPAPAAQFGYLDVSILTDVVSLRQPGGR